LDSFVLALPDHLKFLVLILFGLGLRISEALALKWGDFDLDAGTVQIRRRWYRGDLAEQTKTESSTAELRLSASMLTEVKLHCPGPHKRGSFLLVGDDGLMPPDDRDLLRLEFRPILKRLGLCAPSSSGTSMSLDAPPPKTSRLPNDCL
jgi:integrase